MATLAELNGGPIELIDVLEEDEIPWRHIYGTRDFLHWLANVLPTLVSTTVGAQLTPLEQVYACFVEYSAGEPFNDDRRFKSLRRTPDLSVWELKTDDIRVFGWVPRKDCFVAAFGATADEIKTLDLYGRFMALTAYQRGILDLDEPKCIESKDYEDVVSTKPE